MGGEGALNFFFSGRGVRTGFPKCGACELIFASERRGLSAENFQTGLRAKYGQNWGCRGQNFQIFSKGGRSCELSLLLEMGSLWTKGEVWKGGLQRRTSPYRLSSSVPPLPPRLNTIFLKFKKNSSLWVQWDWMSGPFSQLKKDNSKYCTIQKGFETLRQIHGLQKWHFLNGQCQSECNSFGSNWQAVNVNNTFRNLTTKRLATNYMVSGFRSAIIQGIGLYQIQVF